MVYGGANLQLRLEDAERALSGGYDAVIMNFEIPDPVLLGVCERAAGSGTPVVIDAGPARAVDLANLTGVTIISPNETETEALTGISCDSPQDAENAASMLLEQCGARYAVIKLGKRGSLVYDGSAEASPRAQIIAPYEVQAVDATAAGDAFTAAMTIRYLAGDDLARAARFGNAAGAVAATRLGAQPSLPTREEALDLMEARSR